MWWFILHNFSFVPFNRKSMKKHPCIVKKGRGNNAYLSSGVPSGANNTTDNLNDFGQFEEKDSMIPKVQIL